MIIGTVVNLTGLLLLAGVECVWEGCTTNTALFGSRALGETNKGKGERDEVDKMKKQTWKLPPGEYSKKLKKLKKFLRFLRFCLFLLPLFCLLCFSRSLSVSPLLCVVCCMSPLYLRRCSMTLLYDAASSKFCRSAAECCRVLAALDCRCRIPAGCLAGDHENRNKQEKTKKTVILSCLS